MTRELICIVCPAGCRLRCEDGEISGYSCPRGLEYAKTETTAPKRTVTSTVRLEGSKGHPRLPVKTSRAIDKARMEQAVRQLDGVIVTAPVRIGDVVLADAAGSGADFIATRSVEAE